MALFEGDASAGKPEWERYALVASITGLAILGFFILTGAFKKQGTGASSGSVPTNAAAPNSPLYFPTSDSYTSIAYNTSTTNNSSNTTSGLSGQQLSTLEANLTMEQQIIAQLTHDLAGQNAPVPVPIPPTPPRPQPLPNPVATGKPIISSGPNPPAYKKYVVQTGNTLTGIAQRFGVPLSTLEQANYQTIVNTANRYGNPVPGGPFNNIFPNEVLNIPV